VYIEKTGCWKFEARNKESKRKRKQKVEQWHVK